MSKCLVLGPAGMGIFSIIGNLKSIEERLDLFHEISGSSAGAIVALFLGIGMSVDQIFDAIMGVDTSALSTTVSLKNILTMYGGISPEYCKDILRNICGGDPTFSELKKKVHISAYNLELSRTDYFSTDSHPTMKVIDAVYMSASIPFIFASQNMYVDGAFSETIPLAPFLQYKNEDVYIIEVLVTSEFKIRNFTDFSVSIIRNIMRNRHDYPQYTNRVKIYIDTQQMTEFTMSTDDKLTLYIKGFKEKIIYL